MSSRLHLTVILLIFISILTTDCTEINNKQKGGIVKKLRNAIGIKPNHKENDIETLKNLVLFDADLIKVAAYKKLIKMFKEDPSKRSSLITAIIIAATELVKYYAATSEFVKGNAISLEGQNYAKKCFIILKKEEEGLCHKLTTQLYAAHYLGHKLNGNRLWRKWLKESLIKAKNLLTDDRTLAFLETQIACEIKLKVQNKKEYSIAIKSIFMGSTKNEENFNCIDELLKFKDEIFNVGSYIGEYFYLLGRAYAKSGDYKKASQSLQQARKDTIVDSKRRVTNKAVQGLIEKLFFRINS